MGWCKKMKQRPRLFAIICFNRRKEEKKGTKIRTHDMHHPRRDQPRIYPLIGLLTLLVARISVKVLFDFNISQFDYTC